MHTMREGRCATSQADGVIQRISREHDTQPATTRRCGSRARACQTRDQAKVSVSQAAAITQPPICCRRCSGAPRLTATRGELKNPALKTWVRTRHLYLVWCRACRVIKVQFSTHTRTRTRDKTRPLCEFQVTIVCGECDTFREYTSSPPSTMVHYNVAERVVSDRLVQLLRVELGA